MKHYDFEKSCGSNTLELTLITNNDVNDVKNRWFAEFYKSSCYLCSEKTNNTCFTGTYTKYPLTPLIRWLLHLDSSSYYVWPEDKMWRSVKNRRKKLKAWETANHSVSIDVICHRLSATRPYVPSQLRQTQSIPEWPIRTLSRLFRPVSADSRVVQAGWKATCRSPLAGPPWCAYTAVCHPASRWRPVWDSVSGNTVD